MTKDKKDKPNKPNDNEPKGKATGYHRKQADMDKKDAFINDVMVMTNGLSKYYTDRSKEIHKSYFDNAFSSSITQEDLDRLYPGVVLADFTAGITLMDNMNKFVIGDPQDAPSVADYQATINKLRITGLV